MRKIKIVNLACGLILSLNCYLNSEVRYIADGRMHVVNVALSKDPRFIKELCDIWEVSEGVLKNIETYEEPKRELEGCASQEQAQLKIMEENLFKENKKSLIALMNKFAFAMHSTQNLLRPIIIGSIGSETFEKSILNDFLKSDIKDVPNFLENNVRDLAQLKTLAKHFSMLAENIVANLSRKTITDFLKEYKDKLSKDLKHKIIKSHKTVEEQAKVVSQTHKHDLHAKAIAVK